jgi:hypothetical protein
MGLFVTKPLRAERTQTKTLIGCLDARTACAKGSTAYFRKAEVTQTTLFSPCTNNRNVGGKRPRNYVSVYVRGRSLLVAAAKTAIFLIVASLNALTKKSICSTPYLMEDIQCWCCSFCFGVKIFILVLDPLVMVMLYVILYLATKIFMLIRTYSL